MQKLIGFLPDADPVTPGVITSCTNLVPYDNGMKGAPTGLTPSGVPALAAACLGAAVVTKLDDTRRIFAGTTTKLWELVAGTWTDRTGTAYTGGADTRWSFAQFGDTTVAANLADEIQSSSAGAFADIATAPKAKIVFSVGAFVMALNTDDGTYGTQPDRWWCCASYDVSSWTPSLTTLATTGRLEASPGKITAGGRLGDYAVAYKEDSIYIAQYVGAPSGWDWLPVPGGAVGCVGPDAWCDIGNAHFFINRNGPYIFDGSRPQPVGEGKISRWFADNSNPAYLYRTKCAFDKANNSVWVFYVSSASTSCDAALVFHLGTQHIGHVTTSIESVLSYIEPGITIDTLNTVSATIDGLSAYSFDSAYWTSGGRSLAVVNTSHQLQSMTGAAGTSGFVSADIGDDDTYSLLSKVRLRFAPGYKPTTATMQGFTKATGGDALTLVTSATIADGHFDVLQSGRYHRLSFTFTGDVRVTDIGAEMTQGGLY